MKKILALTFIITALCLTACDDDYYYYDYSELYYDSSWTSTMDYVAPNGAVLPGFRIIDMYNGTATITDYDYYGEQLPYSPVRGRYTAEWDDYTGEGIVIFYGPDGNERWYVEQTRTHLLDMPNPWGLVMYTGVDNEAFYPGDIFNF